MLKVTNIKNRIIEKIIRDKNGRSFRAYFLVVEREGRMIGKIIRVERLKIKDLRKNTGSVYLPIHRSPKNFQLSTFNFKLTPSPFFSTIETFFMSQMTRAPSRSF